MTDLRIVDAPVLLQESITDDVKMPTGGLGNYAIRLGDIVWYVVTKEQLANKNYVDLSSKAIKDSLDTHISDKTNPHQVTKAQVGLSNVDNTADIDKPVSNAVSSAITTATTDMATKAYVNSKDNLKADKATTLSGYGITDAYTKAETDDKITTLSSTTYAGHKGYAALVLAQAAQASLPANTLVEVTNDSDSTKNGVYLWNGTTLTKSTYDPLTLAKADATTKANAAEVNAKTYADNTKTAKSVVDNNTGTGQILVVSDADGKSVVNIDNTGAVFLAGETKSVQDQLKINTIVYKDATTRTTQQTVDSTGVATSCQTLDGNQYLPNLDYSVQTEIKRLKSRLIAQSALFSLSQTQMNLAAQVFKFANSQVQDVRKLAVIADYAETNTVQRTPAILQVDSKTLLYMWGGAISGYSGDAEGVKLYKRLLTINSDYSVTAKESRVLVASPTADKGVSKHPMLGKTANGRIILVYDERENTTVNYSQYIRFSDDGGQTFTDKTQLPSHPTITANTALGTTGKILTTKTGRLLIPMYSTKGDIWICYSDDNGQTWNHGASINGFGFAEPAIAFDSGDNILVSIRQDGGSDNKKSLAKSTDNGQTLTLVGFIDDLTSNPCASSLLYDSDFKMHLHGTPKLSHIAARRYKYQIQISFDDGINFVLAIQPFDTEYYIGYSHIIKLAKGVYAVALEGLTYNVTTNARESSGLFIFNLKEGLQNVVSA